MRPVRLDLEGFASFRDRAVVDFADADYFALVGPTGSGKSTIIDAMTFALYGSAPRWGKSNAIADALAPTSNRCTVRLVFEAAGQRYVVAREVRRSGKAVQQKNVVLERLADPAGVGAEGEVSEVLAGDLREVTRAVEQLLGLSFSDFCQCIVLPQGQFADFLKATPRDRQEILLKLLGADQYESIREAANQRAAVADEKALVLGAQLGELADVTDEALTEARSREAAVTALEAEVATALGELQQVAAEAAEAAALLATLTHEQDLLAGLTRPDGVAELQADQERASTAHRTAVDAELAAVEADGTARTALADGPARGALELVLERLAERERLATRRPDVETADEAAQSRELTGRSMVDDVSRLLEAARDTRDTARTDLATAETALADLRQRRAALADVRTPEGVSELGALVAAARAALEQAAGARGAAEAADEQARSAAAAAPPRGPLAQALTDHATRERLTAELGDSRAEQSKLTAAATAADRDLATTRKALAAARTAHERAVTTEAAAHLRPHLVAGEPCPVCAQAVAVLPPPLDLGALAEAAGAVRQAEAAADRSQSAATAAHRDADSSLAALQSRTAETERLSLAVAAAIAGYPNLGSSGQLSILDAGGNPDDDLGAWERELDRIDGLGAAVPAAGQRLAAAREAERDAQRELSRLDGEVARARARLRTTQGPLIAAGAPELDDSDLPAAWTSLAGWARDRIAELDAGAGPEATAAAQRARTAFEQAQQALQQADTRARQALAEHHDALRAAEQAAAARRTLTGRLAELAGQLRGAPTADQAREQLALCDRLEADARRTADGLRLARTALRTAEQARAAGEQRAAQARRDLRAARDGLVPLGAPAVDDSELGTAWDTLLTWAAREATDRGRRAPVVQKQLAAATEASDAGRAALLELVRGRGVEAPEGVPPAHVPTLVAAARERARAEADRIAEQLQRAAALGGELAAAREQQQVSRLLANLLRSDQFPRWLATAALDTLVTDASETLYELSGGQFHLAHDRGEFVVIDHADADSRRSVRTLSGGETFQASLALALALSAQLSTLAAAGAARLDSIFLDEGFGTLDPETLEVVAETLENLARGERMVGVITHVAALADRAPVRFAVQRDGRTSSVVREGAVGLLEEAS